MDRTQIQKEISETEKAIKKIDNAISDNWKDREKTLKKVDVTPFDNTAEILRIDREKTEEKLEELKLSLKAPVLFLLTNDNQCCFRYDSHVVYVFNKKLLENAKRGDLIVNCNLKDLNFDDYFPTYENNFFGNKCSFNNSVPHLYNTIFMIDHIEEASNKLIVFYKILCCNTQENIIETQQENNNLRRENYELHCLLDNHQRN